MNPNLRLALENVKVHGLSANSAAIKHNVSKSTLLRRVNNLLPDRRGIAQIFCRYQEELFYMVAKRFEYRGRPIEINDVMDMVKEVVARKGRLYSYF